MDEMTPRERFVASMTFQPVDRCFLKPDGFSPLTIQRWGREGLPTGVDPNQYFGHDPREFVRVNMECYPPFEERVLEQGDEYVVKLNSEGITLRQRKEAPLAAMPAFLDWPVKTQADFERMKERYQVHVAGRYPDEYEGKLDYWNNACSAPVAYEFRGMPFHRLRMWMGLEGLCMAMYDDPGWVHQMVEFLEDWLLRVSEKVLSEVKLDYVYACDDIAYKTSSLISPALFHEFFFEPTRRVISRAREAGVPVLVMDSDGNLDEFAQIYLDAGFNTLIPIEVAAGNNLIRMRERFGSKLAFQGGFDKRVLARGREPIRAEVMRLYPPMMAGGGFAPNIDHDVPDDVSLENYRYYCELTREVAEDPYRFL